MTSAPKISVVIPVYNVEQFIEKCLDSVLCQDFEDYEVVLIDDGSTDESAHICKRYSLIDSRIKYHYKENGGLSSARNFGIKRSSGEYLTFIDSDDYIAPDYLSHLFRLAKENSADISCCFYNVENAGSIKPWRSADDSECLFSSRDAMLCLFQSHDIDVCAVCKLYKRQLFDDVEFPVGKLFEDVGTTYKLLEKANAVAVSHKPLYFYVMREDSIVHKADRRIFDRSRLAHEALSYVRVNHCNDYELILAAERYAAFHSLSTLRCVDLSDAEQLEIAQKMRKILLSQKKRIKSGGHASRLDRIALSVLPLGLKTYQQAWRLFSIARSM